MTEQNSEILFSEKYARPLIFVFYAIIISNLVYVILVYILDMQNFSVSQASNNFGFFSYLPYFFGLFVVISLLMISKVFLPMIDKIEDISKIFMLLVVNMVIAEISSIFGLLLAILNITAEGKHVDWLIIGPFFLISIFTELYILQNVIKPKLRSLYGKPYNR